MNNRWFPPEWHEQSAVMLTWPHEHSDWAAILHQVEPVFTEISYYASLHEQLIIVACNQDHRVKIQNLLQQRGIDLAKVHIYIHQGNDTWARDHGPITVFENQKPLLLDFIFNGWGNKFPSDLDNEITRALLTQDAFGDLQLHSVDFVLEGGGIETDGEGTLLTTSQCLLAHTRNPALSYSQIETVLTTHLGVDRFLWLDHGALAGDDTDSHIDTLARFCDPHTIAYCYCDEESDEHFAELQRMEQQLQTFRTKANQPYRLVRLPLPSAKYDDQGKRLPATYANFLIINHAVLVPTYQDTADEQALQILQRCFPEREIIGIDCSALIRQYGSLHCVTMQLPVGVIA
ncbi:agmatine deiminase family protein [Kaarinaea lacus]